MNMITVLDYNEALQKDIYYKDRWGYYSAVIELLKNIPFTSSLEVGCKILPIVKDGKTMDIAFDNSTYNHDATQLPYSFIKDKEFDLLIGLQVLEHLHPFQKEVFQEWKRIAKYIVISLPYLWHCPNDIMHHNIGMEQINAWTKSTPVITKIVNSRIILIYETDNSNS